MKLFKYYIFDLGGVILDINMQNALDGFRTLGIPEDELRFDKGKTAVIMQRYQLGPLTTEQFCDAIISRCVVQDGSPAPTRKQVSEVWNSICLGIPKYKLDALRALKNRANVYLLSNTNELHWQYCLSHYFNTGYKSSLDFFHEVFLSQNLHLEKPNPEIFKRTMHEIATSQSYDTVITSILDEENTVFFDDNADNVAAARSCGISAIHVTPDYDWVNEVFSK